MRTGVLLIFLTSILANPSFGQSSKDEQLVKNVVLAYQDDYNDGGFKNVASYTAKVVINWRVMLQQEQIFS